MKPTIYHPDLQTEILTPEGCWILESSNNDSDSAVSIARARVMPGTTTQWHCLRGVEERYLIISGSGIMRTGTLAPAKVGPGDIVVIPAGVPQQITNDGETDLIFYCICTPRFSPGCYQSLAGRNPGPAS
jgi:mannose-6-phosphate isomerase-like protein (cupin superfamily)